MKLKTLKYSALTLLTVFAVSCKEGKSYSELLDDETNAVNWYLAQNHVETSIPADSNFVVGKDAPFYKMNKDGSVYMRVISKGDMDNRPVKGETVYFRFMRYDIGKMYLYGNATPAGNTQDMSIFPTGMNFIYGNNILPNTTQYGAGLQVPLNYLGYNCEVDLIVKSTEGFTNEITTCTPYVYKNLKYFKAIY